jgi:hypothetical protein
MYLRRYVTLGFPGDGRNECVCHIQPPNKGVHLCTEFRQEEREMQTRTRLLHLHKEKGDCCDRESCVEIEHFVNPIHAPNGESGFFCGLDDDEKLASYQVNPADPGEELDLRGMLRVCLHCELEIFVLFRPG